MRIDEFKKKYGLDKEADEDDKASSLEGKALQRALHPDAPRVGTPHDWEDWERYQKAHADDDQRDDDKG